MPDMASNVRAAGDSFDDDLNLSIVGLGVQYPPDLQTPDAVETLAKRFHPPSEAMSKVLAINRVTGINTRAAFGSVDHPLLTQPSPPSIRELDQFFRTEGVELMVKACQKAMNEWGGSKEEITHIVATTCTNSANPGFDHYVRKKLGLRKNVERVLLHGIGCSGGLAAIRTAANLALGFSHRRKPARILVFACEITTLLLRSELESIATEGRVRIGACLFADGASACVVSNNIGDDHAAPIYNIRGWHHDMLEDTEHQLGFDIDPLGYKVILEPQVPFLASAAVPAAFHALLKTMPAFSKTSQDTAPRAATDFDWALHPGGASVLTGIQTAMQLPDENLLASWQIYSKYGNCSSATIMSVMNRLRYLPRNREDVVACAFGPGISLEMIMLKRVMGEHVYTNGNGSGDAALGLNEHLSSLNLNGGVAQDGNHPSNGHVAPTDEAAPISNGVNATVL